MEKYTLKPRNPGEALKKPEPILKRKQHDVELLSRKAKRRLQVKKSIAKQKKDADIITPAKLVHDSQVCDLDAKRFRHWMKIRDKTKLKVLFQNRHKVILVIRNMRTPVSKLSYSVLKELNLTRYWSAIFLPNTSSSLATLKAVEPFVIYGYLEDNSLRKLILKYLRLKPIKDIDTNNLSDNKDTKQAPDAQDLSCSTETMKYKESIDKLEPIVNVDNSALEKRMGHLGILCLEDLIQEIKTCNSNFVELSKQLAPFQLPGLKKSLDIEANVVEFGNLKLDLNKRIEKII